MRASLIYPVFSRRSGGLSVGIDLFPDGKRCSFDCPYCELFPSPEVGPGRDGSGVGANRATATGPGSAAGALGAGDAGGDVGFSLQRMEEELRSLVADGRVSSLGGVPVRDFCFSGSGEPTLSPRFPEALAAAARLRDELAPAASLVVISNGGGLSDDGLRALLGAASRPRPEGYGLDHWIKVDAGTEDWYRKIDRGTIAFDRLIGGIEAYFACAAGTVQTMLCSVAGAPPGAEEERAWLALVSRLASTGGVRRVHIYGKARPAPGDPLAERLPLEVLEDRAERLRAALEAQGRRVPVAVFE